MKLLTYIFLSIWVSSTLLAQNDLVNFTINSKVETKVTDENFDEYISEYEDQLFTKHNKIRFAN